MPHRLHVLLVPVGSHGDVHPFVGLGRRLLEHGHRVTMVTNDHYEPLARQAGLEFTATSTGEDFRKIISDPELWHKRKGIRVIMKNILALMRPTYEQLAQLAAKPGEPIAMVASSLGLAARIAQEKSRLPLATVHLSPSVFQSVHDMPRYPGLPLPRWSPTWARRLTYRIINSVIDRGLAPDINAFRGELGLPPVSGIFKSWWNSPDLVLAMFPDWYGPAQPDWPPNTHTVGFPLFDESGLTPLSPQLSAFLDAGTPPIAFTPGSAMYHGRAFFETSAAACARLGCRGLLLSRHPNHIPLNLPPGVIHVDYAPFSELLPRCAALVHHGGIGTSSQALAAGVPQLIQPFTHDQPDNADRLGRLGVAAVITQRKYTPARAAEALRTLLDSGDIKASCAAIATRMSGMDALGNACERIEHLAAAK